MGPFPHSAPKAEITEQNPAGTDGFEFIEFAHPEPEKLRDYLGNYIRKSQPRKEAVQPSKAELEEGITLRNPDGSIPTPEEVVRAALSPATVIEDLDA